MSDNGFVGNGGLVMISVRAAQPDDSADILLPH